LGDGEDVGYGAVWGWGVLGREGADIPRYMLRWEGAEGPRYMPRYTLIYSLHIYLYIAELIALHEIKSAMVIAMN